MKKSIVFVLALCACFSVYAEKITIRTTEGDIVIDGKIESAPRGMFKKDDTSPRGGWIGVLTTLGYDWAHFEALLKQGEGIAILGSTQGVERSPRTIKAVADESTITTSGGVIKGNYVGRDPVICEAGSPEISANCYSKGEIDQLIDELNSSIGEVNVHLSELRSEIDSLTFCSGECTCDTADPDNNPNPPNND